MIRPSVSRTLLQTVSSRAVITRPSNAATFQRAVRAYSSGHNDHHDEHHDEHQDDHHHDDSTPPVGNYFVIIKSLDIVPLEY